MASSNPLTDIDILVAEALTGYGGLTALVPVSKIQVWDRTVDIRGEVETAPDLGKRVWVVPGRSTVEMSYSSSSVRWKRRYAIGFGAAGLKVEACREIEFAITKALARLFELKKPDLTPITQPTPLEVESISIGDTDPEREPLGDPEEWTDVCDVMVLAFSPRAALLLL